MRVNLLRTGATLSLAASLLTGCNQGQNGTGATSTDTPTSGALAISVDETFAPIIRSEVDTFQKLYQNAKVTAYYKPEQEAIQDLRTTRAKLSLLTPYLCATARDGFHSIQLAPRTM